MLPYDDEDFINFDIDLPEIDVSMYFNNRLAGLMFPSNYEFFSELEDVKIGLISEEIVKKTIVRQSKDINFCTICQEDIFLDIERVLPCNHFFHINCIDVWFTKNKKCPTCRQEI